MKDFKAPFVVINDFYGCRFAEIGNSTDTAKMGKEKFVTLTDGLNHT